jgi:hypothetical protein
MDLQIYRQPAGTHKRVVVSLMAGGHLLLASVLFVNAAKTKIVVESLRRSSIRDNCCSLLTRR